MEFAWTISNRKNRKWACVLYKPIANLCQKLLENRKSNLSAEPWPQDDTSACERQEQHWLSWGLPWNLEQSGNWLRWNGRTWRKGEKESNILGLFSCEGVCLIKKIELDFKGCAGTHFPSRIKDTFTQQSIKVDFLILQRNWQGESLPWESRHLFVWHILSEL